MAQVQRRKRPNILITGTPGTGKTSTAAAVAELTGLKHVCVADVIKEKRLHGEYDAEFDTFALDEDKVCDELEDLMSGGGCVVDFHTCDFFPERWFQLVIVLRTSNEVLFPRLERRGYKPNKIQENIEAEIMQVCLDEARESYRPEVVKELPSNNLQDLETNVRHIAAWLQEYMSRPGDNDMD